MVIVAEGWAVEMLPNASVGGFMAICDDTAACTFSLPAPADRIRAGPASSCKLPDAVFTTADLSCAGLYPGCACLTSATAPATIAAEKLLPSTVGYPEASYRSEERRVGKARTSRWA